MKRVFLFIGFTILLAACKPEPIIVSEVVEVLVTATLTNTPTAIPTIPPTATLSPTAVSTTTPSPTAVPDHPRVLRNSTTPMATDRQPTINIYFDQVMNQHSVEEAVQISPSVPRSFHWENDKLRHITVEEVLPPAASYAVTSGKTAVSHKNIPAQYSSDQKEPLIIKNRKLPKG